MTVADQGHWRVEHRDYGIRLTQTRRGRLAAARRAFGVALIIALIAMAALFVPDFLRTRHDEAEGYGAFFALFVSIGALGIATIAALLKYRSHTRWEFDRQRGVIRWRARTSLGRRVEDEFDLDEISSAETRDETLLLVLHEGGQIELAAAPTPRAELDELRASIEETLR